MIMKHRNFLKAVFTLVLCASISTTFAADIYLSGAGADTNDGLSTGTAVKTLSKAFTICLEGDVIHVMDMININQEPTKTTARTDIDVTAVDATKILTVNGVTYTTWNAGSGTVGIIPHTRSITIVGDDKASCGFDGNDVSCIIRQDHGGSGVATITYKNLTFKNGKSADNSGGGAVYVRLSNTAATGQAANFVNCDFIANKSKNDKPGGAFSVIQYPSVVNFKHCRFAENIASKGAALYFERGTVSIDSCVFENHDLSVEALPHLTSAFALTSVGAAIHTNVAAGGGIATLDVKNTLFKNNKAGANGGAFSTSETNAITAGATNAKFTNCAFVDNTSGTGVGGAVYLNTIMTGPSQDILFVNSTFKGNQTGASTGGAIGVSNMHASSKFGLINCTVSGNKVSGTTGAGGAGVRFLSTSSAGTRTIKNSILENNTAVDANMSSAADYADLGMEDIVNVDLTTAPSYVAGTTLIIEKSLIGSCKNANFDTEFPLNKTNYAFELNGSIVNSFKAKLGVFDEEKNYFPLLATSEAIGYGNSTFLSSLTPAVTTDQIGRNRPAVNCSAGAYEFETVAAGLKNTVNNSILVYKNANNQITVKNTAESTNSGTITVCNMVGQVITSAPINGSITTINKSLRAGAYLVMVAIDGNVSTKKVILN